MRIRPRQIQIEPPLDPGRWSTFDEFESWVAGLATEHKRGRVFERFVHAYLIWSRELELNSVWTLGMTPRSILDTLGIRRNDIGVDLIARRRDNTIWAIQAKFRSDRRPVPWRELATFIGASQKADHRLLVGNQRKLPRNLPKPLPKFGSALLDSLLPLAPDFFRAWAAMELAQRPLHPRPLTPRLDQKTAASRLAKSLASTPSRSQLVSACGTGKTLTAFLVAEKLNARRTVIFTPSLALVHQTLKTWSNQARDDLPIEAMCVCSDVSVGDVHPYELPVPVTTVVQDIRNFWIRRLTHTRRVIFATYRSAGVVGEATRKIQTDLMIADEAHRVAGPGGKAFQIVLDDATFRAKRRLFMTATPRISAPHYKKREEKLGRDLVSMDDSLRFGNVAHTLTFGEAITLGLLSDYQIDVLGVTSEETASFIRNRTIVDDGLGDLDAETLAQALALKKALHDGLFKYAFSFHHSRRNARTFLATLKHVCTGIGDLYAANVFGDMPVAERVEVLRELLRSERGVICSARALNEGVDAPALDAVVFVDPKSSVIDIVQAVGRALRRDIENPGKLAHIVVPVPVTVGDDPETALAHSAWHAVWQVLVAMQSHDVRIAEEIRDAVLERGRRRIHGSSGGSVHLSKLNIVLPPSISLDRFADTVMYAALDSVGGFLPFELARRYIQGLGFTTVREFEAWRHTRPADIPAAPNLIYRHQGWAGWGNFLGTGRHGKNWAWRSFEDARQYIRRQGFQSTQEFRKWLRSGKKPADIPYQPHRSYADDGWRGYGDFLGTDHRERVGHKVKWRSFARAREYVRGLELQGTREYHDWASSDSRPGDISCTPDLAYRGHGWESWSDFLGVRVRQHGKWRPFLQARDYVRSLRLNGTTAWIKWASSDQRPYDIPTDPARVYASDEWKGMADWLGTDNVPSHLIVWKPFEEARAWVRSQNISSQKEWFDASRCGLIPKDIPHRPDVVYRDQGWLGYRDWLGRGFWSFEEAKAFAHTLGLQTYSQWRKWRKNRPGQMPSSPDDYYSSEWMGWADFLRGREGSEYGQATSAIKRMRS